MTKSRLSSWPSFNDAEIEAATETLRSNAVNYWTGSRGREFEKAFARWNGSAHAVALANGTLAIDVALKALGVGPGDEVIVTPRSFMASVSSIVLAGAKPVFADVDLDSGNITAASIESVITPATKAIVPVHLAGWPCDMDEIMALARSRGLFVIEDCAQAHGAMIGNRAVGSIGDVGAWSFCQDKIMTTGGEGGMVTTQDEGLWSAMWSYKDHGKDWDAVYNQAHEPGYRWVHRSFGTNWRMLEIQAAIGILQLKSVDAWVARRTEIAMRLRDVLLQFPDLIRAPVPADEFTHAYYRFYGYLNLDAISADWSRDRIIAEISGAGFPVFHGSCSELYLEGAFEGTGLRPSERLPNARKLGETSLMFLTHPTITDEQVDGYASAVSSVLERAAR